MSALGFGLFVGALGTAVAVGPRAFLKPVSFNAAIILGGFLAWMLVPAIIPEFGGFLVGLVTPPLGASLALKERIESLHKDALAKLEQAAEERLALEERREKAKSAEESWATSQLGWTHISRGRLMHKKGQPSCFFMLSANRLLVRVVEYQIDPDFWIGKDIGISVASVISLNVASPTITKTRTKTVPVTIVEQRNKSTVGRGLIGGALLGPAGVILGAASGLNSDLKSSIQHETVSEKYDTLGDPQLIIGTSDADQPVWKIKFDPPGIADEWMFRIQGAKAAKHS